jgi:hypothetical protein
MPLKYNFKKIKINLSFTAALCNEFLVKKFLHMIICH